MPTPPRQIAIRARCQPSAVVRLLLLASGAAAAALGACSPNVREADGSDLEAPGTFGAEAVAPILSSFAPTSVRLHPLSRWDAQAVEPTLLIYVELLDDSNDPVKWPASVTLTITPSGTTLSMSAIAEPATPKPNPAPAQPEAAGTPVRFRFASLDATAAARTFDPVSRSYLARLTGLPRWAAARPQVTVDILSICPLPPDSVIELEYQGGINAQPASPAAAPAATPAPAPAPAHFPPDGL